MIYNEKTLGELCDLKIGRTPPRNETQWFNAEEDYYNWVSIKDMFNKKTILKTSENISKEAQKKFNIPIVKKGTVILSFKLTLGRVCICGEDMLTNEAIAQLPIINPDELDRNYLYYYLKSYDYSKLGNTSSIATAVNSKILKEMIVSYPEILIQKKIAKVLSKIDDKIDLNISINDNLHLLMEKAFDNEFNNIDNYETAVLSDIANFKNGLAMQNYRPYNDSDSFLPVIKIKEMNNGLSSDTEKCRMDIPNDVLIENGDVLFAWSGTLCMKIWDQGKAGLNQHIFKVTSDKYPKWFYYFWTYKHLNKFIEIAAGKATTMGHIKRSELDKAEVKIPDKNKLLELNNYFEPMMQKYILNELEIVKLTKLRDTILTDIFLDKVDLSKVEV